MQQIDLPVLPKTSPLIDIDLATHERICSSINATKFAPFFEAIEDQWLTALKIEADARASVAVSAEQEVGLCYKASITDLGPVALSFLTNPDIINLLGTYFGGSYILSEDISCLTFYDESSHLGAHLDEPAEKCAVTIILYLQVTQLNATSHNTGLVLNVYGPDKSSIGVPKLKIATRSGTLVLGRGSEIWHERPTLQVGEAVIAITGCYELLP